jgi:hypothetical protein
MQTDIHASGGIRTHDPSAWAGEDIAGFRGAGTFISLNPWGIRKQTLDWIWDVTYAQSYGYRFTFLSILGYEPVSYGTVAIRSCLDKKLLHEPSCLTHVQYYVQQRCTNVNRYFFEYSALYCNRNLPSFEGAYCLHLQVRRVRQATGKKQAIKQTSACFLLLA